MNIDLHNHTTLCNHANGSMEEYVTKAIEQKIDIFGFSEHAPMNFDQKYRMKMDDIEYYYTEILRLKEKYRNDIEIKYGYEVDYLPNFHEESILCDKNIDYLIGSVHFLDSWGFDNPEFIGEYEKRDINQVHEEYYKTINAMAKSELFDIVGHLDLIKVFKFFPTKDMSEHIYEALKAIKNSGMVIEVNFAGMRKPIGQQYPSLDILELAFELDIPITFGSDAHSVEQIGLNREKVYELIKAIGYTKAASFTNREMELYKF